MDKMMHILDIGSNMWRQRKASVSTTYCC